MKISKRKTRSDKFPLTLHPTGQYCKKIKGKIDMVFPVAQPMGETRLD